MSTVEKTEENRYIGGDGKPINLAQTSGHFRLQLTKVRKFNNITDESNLQLNDNKKTSVAQTKSSTKTKGEEEDKKSTNDCAINTDGQKVTTHV